jgi:hypothetical protein
MATDISYIIRAATQGAQDCWLTEPRLGGHRTFATRQNAARFKTVAQADAAIGVMTRRDGCRGIVFTVEAAN